MKASAKFKDNPDFVPKVVYIRLDRIAANKGQLSKIDPVSGEHVGVPKNPRWIRDARYKALKKSISDDPEYLNYNPLKVFSLGCVGRPNDFVVIDGNHRRQACIDLGFEEVPCMIFLPDTPMSKLRAWAIKGNLEFAQNDWDALANEWDLDELQWFGLELTEIAPPDEPGKDDDEEEGADNGAQTPPDDPGDDDDEPKDEDHEYGSEFADMMYKDVLYPSDNDLEIPMLDMKMQAGRLELPLSAWGADRRSRTDIVTYHFYVDDYRFEKLFRDPVNLLSSGCKAIVEPNCSLHDQTPIAFGLNQIYKKRYLARYCLDVGIAVYVDLNVAEKFRPYNKMGVPKGYNAFATRGLDGWLKSLENDLKDAQEISGLECPNLIVYGGGKEVEKFCQEHGLLYVTDFINAKKL